MPKRACTWASSQPTAPPPSTSRLAGRCCADSASSLVQVGTASSPSTGGTTAREPVATTRSVQASSRPSTVTTPGAVTRPEPRTSTTPACSSSSAAPASSRCSATSSRRATAARKASSSVSRAGAVVAPASSARRRAWSRASALRSIALLGMHATYGHSPPTRSCSTSATERPCSARVVAMLSPAEPAPRTTTSKVSMA